MNKYAYKGNIITASSREEAVRVFAENNKILMRKEGQCVFIENSVLSKVAKVLNKELDMNFEFDSYHAMINFSEDKDIVFRTTKSKASSGGLDVKVEPVWFSYNESELVKSLADTIKELIQNNKNKIFRKESSKNKLDKDDYMHGYCQIWALDNYKKGDRFFVITDYDYDIDETVLVHCGLYRNGKRIDASGVHNSLEDALVEFDYGSDVEETIENRDEFLKTLKSFKLPTTVSSRLGAPKKIVADTYGVQAPTRLAYYIINDLNLDLTDDNLIRIKLPNYNDAGSLIDYDFSHLGQIYKKDNDWFFTDDGRTIQVFVESDGDVVNQDKFKEALASNIQFYKDIFQRSAKKKLSWYDERLKDLK